MRLGVQPQRTPGREPFFCRFLLQTIFINHLKLENMNTIIGRITRDAVVKELSDDRQVVEFSVAVNDFYKKKGAEKGTTVTNYYNCSFWLNAKSADRLKKGTLVQLFGRLTVNAYTDQQGNAKATLNFHVNSFTIHQMPKTETVINKPAEISEPVDDLPF